MARQLIKKRNERIEHPDDPQLWFVVRVPLSAGDLAAMTRPGVGGVLDIAQDIIAEWCYDGPITKDTVALLPVDDLVWFSTKVNEFSGIRDDAAKNASGASSSPTSAQDAGASLTSSGI